MSLHVRRTGRFLASLVWISFLVTPAVCGGTELKKESLESWDEYVQAANARMQDRLQNSFLWVDEMPDRVQRVRAGKIVVSPAGEPNPKPVPSGLIHDWIGAAFIPNATLDDVLSMVRDYANYKEFYKPNVVESKPLGTTGDCDKYSMVLMNHEAVGSTALDGEYQVCYFRLDERRWYSVAYSTRLQEVKHYGQADALVLPPDQGSGYIWRLYSFARFEERDGGVYVELEGIALSRDIPFAVRWVVNPIVRKISKNAMLTSLRQMEVAVHSKAVAANPAAAAHPN
jgi:hypothetical protein